VERAARQAPWRAEEVQEAQRKLEEADRQLQAGHFGSAVFFSSRASRIAAALGREGRLVAEAGNVRFVSARQLTLVRTPQGQVGWVYAGLLSGG
jgi:hypothetical protein